MSGESMPRLGMALPRFLHSNTVVSEMPDKSWKLLGSRYVCDYRILRVREDRYRFEPSGAEADFFVCDTADWVLILPVTVDAQIIFVRQYRHGVREVVFETPGGIMDEGETAAQTAARELIEETGYQAAQVEIAGTIIPNPALNNARCHVAVATGCVLAGETKFDPFERIETELRPLKELPEIIRSGELSHAQAIAAFSLAAARGFGFELG